MDKDRDRVRRLRFTFTVLGPIWGCVRVRVRVRVQVKDKGAASIRVRVRVRLRIRVRLRVLYVPRIHRSVRSHLEHLLLEPAQTSAGQRKHQRQCRPVQKNIPLQASNYGKSAQANEQTNADQRNRYES